MADSVTSFCSSLDSSISRVTETGRTELTTSVHRIRGYCTFQVDKVRGAVNRRKKGKWNPVNCRKSAGRGKGALGRAKRVVRGLLCVRGSDGREEESDEESLLLEDDRRRRGSQSLSQQLEGHEQKPGTRSGVRADGALRQAGRWLLDGLQSYSELGYPTVNPSLSSYAYLDGAYNWALAWP